MRLLWKVVVGIICWYHTSFVDLYNKENMDKQDAQDNHQIIYQQKWADSWQDFFYFPEKIIFCPPVLFTND